MKYFTGSSLHTVLVFSCLTCVHVSCVGTASRGVRSDAPATVRAFSIRDIQSRFPDSGWIVGFGDSSKDRAAAELAARTRVSEQIESSIQSEFRSYERVVIQSSGRDSSQASSQDVSLDTRTSTSFSHAELIRVVPELTVCDAGTCSAVAVLDRDKAYQALESDYNVAAVAFRNAVSSALRQADETLRRRSDNGVVSTEAMFRFATDHNGCRNLFGKMESMNAQAAAVRHGVDAFPGDLDKLVAVFAAGDSLLRAFPVHVLPEATPEGRIVSERVLGALVSFGVAASFDQGCQSGLVVAPTAAMDCRQGRMNWECEVNVDITLAACPGERQVGRFHLEGLDTVGVSVRNVENARQQVFESLTPEAVSSSLRDRLSDFLPLK